METSDKKNFTSRIFDSIKEKFVEIGSEYAKSNLHKIKNEVMKYVEREIERRIKRELRKFMYKATALSLLGVGIFFLLYSLISGIVFFLQLPEFLSPLFFGFFLIISALIVYLLK